jgi:hypothetical protein
VGCSAGIATGSFDVHVLDSQRPVIRKITATPNVLWPPNHKMVDVVIAVEAEDEIDPSLDMRIVHVLANERLEADDWAITGPLTLQLRAERNGHDSGRIYTIFVDVVDDAGNRTSAAATVRVPHDEADHLEPGKTGRRRAVGRR